MGSDYCQERCATLQNAPDRRCLTSLAKHLEPLKTGKVPLEILIRGKDGEQNAKLWEKIIDVIKTSGVRDERQPSFAHRM